MRKIQPAIRAYLQVIFFIPTGKREEMITGVFLPGRQRFLERVAGAVSMDLLVREEDMQLLHGFDTFENARAYLDSTALRDITGKFAEASDQSPETALYNVD